MAIYPLVHCNGGSERKVSSDEGSKHFLAAPIQILLDVRAQFQSNSRTPLIGTQVQLVLRACNRMAANPERPVA
jgi:hypothetical protein